MLYRVTFQMYGTLDGQKQSVVYDDEMSEHELVLEASSESEAEEIFRSWADKKIGLGDYSITSIFVATMPQTGFVWIR